MFGSPEDVEGECNARLFLRDDYGDGTTTVQCKLLPDHEGLHEERFERSDDLVIITWAKDESFKCLACGKRRELYRRAEDGTCCVPCAECGCRIVHHGHPDEQQFCVLCEKEQS